MVQVLGSGKVEGILDFFQDCASDGQLKFTGIILTIICCTNSNQIFPVYPYPKIQPKPKKITQPQPNPNPIPTKPCQTQSRPNFPNYQNIYDIENPRCSQNQLVILYIQNWNMETPSFFTNPHTQRTPSPSPSCRFHQVAALIDHQNLDWVSKMESGDHFQPDYQLLREYTELVRQRYGKEGLFDNIKSASSANKKKIVLTRKPMPSSPSQKITTTQITTPQMPTTQMPTTQMPTPLPTKNPSHKKSSSLITSTPKKALPHQHHLKSTTAHSHLRSKTGIVIGSGERIGEERGDGVSQSGTRIEIGKGDVDVSEFDGITVLEQEKIACGSISQQTLQTNRTYARTFTCKAVWMENGGSWKTHICPICQQQIEPQQIPTHESSCQKLSTLYKLPRSQLSQYLEWKTNQHLANVNAILTNVQVGNLQNEEEKDKEGVAVEQLGQYLEGVVGQCQDEIRKFLWFEVVRHKLDRVGPQTS